jgi:hypothetical protein
VQCVSLIAPYVTRQQAKNGLSEQDINTVTVDTMQHLARASGEHPLILSLRHKPTTGDDDERKQDAAKQ